MKAEIRHFSMAGGELSEYWPEDTGNFRIGLDATVGPVGERGAEIFSFRVCTPKWFAKNKSENPTFARHTIFVNEYDEEAILNLVRDLVASASGESWDEIATILSRYMFWEFEDYEPYSVCPAKAT